MKKPDLTNFKTNITREYLWKSYFTVDGLWFMVIEEELGFEKALMFDKKVWQILPKIQARLLKNELNFKEVNLEMIVEILGIKFDSEKYIYDVIKNNNFAEFKITSCPWHEVLIKSSREHLGSEIGIEICQTELEAWVKELNDEYLLKTEGRICDRNNQCKFLILPKNPNNK